METDQLKHSELTFQLIVESAPNALVLVNKQGKIAFVNTFTEALFGYKRSELIGQPIELLMPKRFAHSHPAYRNDFFDAPRSRLMGAGRDLFALKKDGTEFPVEIGLNPLVTVEGTMVVAAIIDITERKKAEEKEALFASIINSSDDAIISKTLEGVITSWNAGAEKLFGYSAGEITGKNVSILIPPDRINEEHEIIEKIKKGKYVEHYETERRRKDGSLVYTSLTVSPIKNKEGKITGASKIARDITNRKLAEEQIMKAGRLYSFLSHINQSIVHKQDEQSLFDEACRITTGIGKFEMAWIGVCDATRKKINLVAQENATQEDIKFFSHFTFDNDGPISRVLTSGKYYLSNNAIDEPEGSKSKEYALKRSFGSFISLPIKKQGQTFGAFNIYSSSLGSFDKEEITLLEEAANDISFALEIFEKEKLLKQSEKRLKGAQKIAHLGDWEFDLLTNKTLWSDEYYRIFGMEPGSVEPTIGYVLKFTHPDDRERIDEQIKNSRATLTPFEHFRRIIRTDGMVRHIYGTGRYDFDEDNNPIRLHGTALDITEITEKEEELKNSELKFRDFFENAPEALLILDVESGAFLSVNNNAVKLFKYPYEELITKTPMDISPGFQQDGSKSSEKAIEYLNAVAKGAKPVFEWAVLDAEGKEFICEVRVTKLSGMNSNNVMGSFVDITERKNYEREREKITSDLLQRNKDLEQFTYIVSHNLRAPVANILGITDLLQNGSLDKKDGEMMLGDLGTSVTRLDTVIKDLNYILQVKRDITESKEIIKFSRLVDEIKASIASQIKKENAEIVYNFMEADEMHTLKSYIYSVFFNLISNSIKYRQPKLNPVIEITSARINNKIILTFKDNGLGIDLKRKGDQVFGLYKRFHTHAEGKGMGLYMVKTQVEIMGGNISIASEVNKGTIFTIEFDNHLKE